MRTLMLALLIVVVSVAMCSAREKDVFDDWYGMLEMQGGTTFDFKTQVSRVYIAGPIFGYRAVAVVGGTEIDVDEETEAKGPVTALLGVTYNLGSLRDMGVDAAWAQHFAFNVGPCVTYEFETGDVEWKAMLSVVALSFDDGNVKRHRRR